MEYASGGELYDYIDDKKGLEDKEARKFFRQIVSAINYLHQVTYQCHNTIRKVLNNPLPPHTHCSWREDFSMSRVFTGVRACTVELLLEGHP